MPINWAGLPDVESPAIKTAGTIDWTSLPDQKEVEFSEQQISDVERLAREDNTVDDFFYHIEDKEKANITNLNQWKFWVLPKKIVEGIFSEKESISVSEISSEFLSVSAKELYSEIQKFS